ncbi:cytochrome P450 [Entophlyctis helioformis]|nr:cytochrome P450 [Entophlyctis helioformis]
MASPSQADAACLGPSHLRQTVDAATEVADKIKADWTSVMAATGEKTIVVDVYKYMGAVAFDVICKIAFSKDRGAVEMIGKNEFSKTAEMFEEALALTQLRIFSPPVMWSWMGISSSSPRVTSVRDSSQAFIMDVIAERRAATSLGEHQAKGKWDMDVLDRFLQNSAELNPDGEGLSEDEIVGETLAMLVAGHETTANSMAFIIMSSVRTRTSWQRLLMTLTASTLRSAATSRPRTSLSSSTSTG